MRQLYVSPHLARLLLASVMICGVPGESWAQRQRGPASPESKTLTTKDGVKLHVTYYASSTGRDATPVVLLHDMKGSSRDLTRLARRLQQPDEDDTHPSFAVVTVDLRGHGDSRMRSGRGGDQELPEPAKLGVQEMRGMVLGDMEAVRKFLVGENDRGKLNLNRMALVGVGLGAVVATNYAANDWAAPELASVKQGKDVKAVVMISPEWKVKGLEMTRALRQPGVNKNIAVLMLYGEEDRKIARNAERVYGQLKGGHPGAVDAKPNTLPDLVKFGVKSKLQGSSLLKETGAKAELLIAKYLEKHTAKEEFQHSKRRPD